MRDLMRRDRRARVSDVMRCDRRVWLAALGAALVGSARGQVAITPRAPGAGKAEEGQRPTLRVDTSLVLIPVAVRDPMNRPVTGLDREHFRIFDDKVEQKITQFAMEDEPVTVGLVFDTSGSMGAKLQRSRHAASEFFRISNPEDDYFLVEFDSAPRLVVPLTRETGTIESRLTFSKSRGSTALLDAIYMALTEMRRSPKTKKALLVISDGGDNRSRYTTREVENLVRESDVLIYSIGIFGGGGSGEEVAGPGLLSRISELTGARLYPSTPNEMPDIARHIGLELRNRYILGYSPTNQARDGRWHQVRVQIVAPRGLPRLRASWRQGYYAAQP